jgi:hypothetical protein
MHLNTVPLNLLLFAVPELLGIVICGSHVQPVSPRPVQSWLRSEDVRISARFPVVSREFVSLQSVQINTGTHPVSYPKSTKSSFLGGKAAGA